MLCRGRLTEPGADPSNRKGRSGGIVDPIQAELTQNIPQLPSWWQSIDLHPDKKSKRFSSRVENLDDGMRRLPSDMVDLKDHVKTDSLKIAVLESMRA